jgi:secondary thiamine-phosphate synthase enzyme
MHTIEVPVGVQSAGGWTDVTGLVRHFCAPLGDGLVNVFAPHSTVGLALMHADEGAGEDVVAAVNRLLPRDIDYRHREKAPGHGADHVVPVLVSPSVTIPVLDGALAIGEFQQVILIDLDEQPSPRRLRLSFVQSV